MRSAPIRTTSAPVRTTRVSARATGRARATLVDRPPGEVRKGRTGRRPGIRRGRPVERTNHCLSVYGLAGCVGQRADPGAMAPARHGDARVDWTTNDVPIWSTLWRDDEDIAAASATWSEGRLNQLRAPR